MPQLSYATRLASYREASEDRAVVIALEDRFIVLVADGAGGITHGGAAADAVVELVRGRAHDLVDVQTCIELIHEADHVVMSTGGETTAVLLVVGDDGIYGASSGDSEAWVIREDGSIDDLTAHQHKKRRVGSAFRAGGWDAGRGERWVVSVREARSYRRGRDLRRRPRGCSRGPRGFGAAPEWGVDR